MSHDERQSYLKAIHLRYKKSSRGQKAIILNEFCAVCGYNRKYAIRLLSKRFNKRNPSKPGRKFQYEAVQLIPHLKAIWAALPE